MRIGKRDCVGRRMQDQEQGKVLGGMEMKVLGNCGLERGFEAERGNGKEEASKRKKREVLGVEEAGWRKQDGGRGKGNNTNTSNYNRTPQRDEI